MSENLESAIPMSEIKEKLLKLKEYWSSADDTICEFARLLSGRLNNQLVPSGFYIAAELLIYDLQKGIDGFTNEPIRSKLVGYPPIIYTLIRINLEQVAEKVCPEDFACGVKKTMQDAKK